MAPTPPRPTGLPDALPGGTPWLRVEEGGCTVALHCQPGARVTEPAGLHGDRFRIKLAAPPVEGKANEELVSWLSEELGVPRDRIRIVSGEASRQKRVRLDGVEAEQVVQLFG